MATFRAGKWTPTFPHPEPAHWTVFVATESGCTVLSDQPLSNRERQDLGHWLTNYSPREPSAEASYVYLGMSESWSPLAPNGQTSELGVTGVGSGIGMGEPGGATASTVADICSMAREALLAPR